MNWGIIQNIIVSFASGVAILVMCIFYFKIWRISREIKKINSKIKEKRDKLNEIEIQSIRDSGEIFISMNDREEKRRKRKKEQEIEGLERQKRYLLEEITIYKIFKK